MVSINKVSHGHDEVYEAVNTVQGGQGVVPVSGAQDSGKQGIGPAGANATNFIGVAARTAMNLASQGINGTSPDGFPEVYASPTNELTTVYKDAIVPVTYTAAAVGFGVKLATAANGAFQAWANTLTADAIVGECRVPGGMSSAGGVGLAYIY